MCSYKDEAKRPFVEKEDTKKWINKNLKRFLMITVDFFFKWRPLSFFLKLNKHNSQMNHGIFVDQFVQNPF